MKIGINARFLHLPFTGIGQYTQGLFSALTKQYPEVEFIMVTPVEVNIVFPKNVRVEVLPEVNWLPLAGLRKTWWEQVQLPKFFREQQIDLVHFPYPSNPWKGFHKPVIVTVHDTIPWSMNSYKTTLLSQMYHEQARKSVKKADVVLTVSEASKRDIIARCDVLERKVFVTYNAPAEIFAMPVSISERENVLKKYGIKNDRKFLLYVGGYDERKNVKLLAQIFAEYIAPHYDIDLIFVGGKSHEIGLYSSIDALKKMQNDAANLKGKILFTGFVEEQDLPALYQSSFIFINLSQKEGCNLPLLEAASGGTVVVASDIAVHREMLGDVGLFVPLDSDKTVAEVLVQLIENHDLYLVEKQKVTGHHFNFSWNKTADQVMKIYKDCV